MQTIHLTQQCSAFETAAIEGALEINAIVRDHLRHVFQGMQSRAKRKITRRRLLQKAYPDDRPEIAHHAVHCAMNPIAPDENADWMFLSGAEAGWIRDNLWHTKIGDLQISINMRKATYSDFDTWPDPNPQRQRGCWLGLNRSDNTIHLIGRNVKRVRSGIDPFASTFNFISSCWIPQCLLPGESAAKQLPAILKRYSGEIDSSTSELPIIAYEASKTDCRMKIDGDLYRSIRSNCDPHAYLLTASIARAFELHHGTPRTEAWSKSRRYAKNLKEIVWLHRDTSEMLRITPFKPTMSIINRGNNADTSIHALLYLADVLEAGGGTSLGLTDRANAINVKVSNTAIKQAAKRFGKPIESRTTQQKIAAAAEYAISKDALTPGRIVSLAHRLRARLTSTPDSLFRIRDQMR